MKQVSFFLAISFMLSNLPAYSWSNEGHKIIVQIAKSQLDKQTVDLIDSYLQGQSWEDAACWMNTVRANPKNKNLLTSHYVLFNADKTYVKVKEDNAINKLDYCIRMLQYRQHQTPDMMRDIVRMMFHVVGDLHQPLDCGYLDDNGGAKVTLKFLDKDSNLHKVWETDIIEEKKIDIWLCTNFLMGMKLTPKKKTEIENLDYLKWMEESRLLLPDIYKTNQGKIDQAYIDKNAEIIKSQLVKAGLRLGALLKANFKVA